MAAAQGGAALDQRVERAHLGRHGVVEQTLAQAPGRHHHPAQVHPLDQRLQHHGGVGHGLGALLGQALDALQRALGLAGDEAAGVQRLARAHLVLVHDPKRIVGQAHLQQGQVPPRAAHGVERLALRQAPRRPPPCAGRPPCAPRRRRTAGRGSGRRGRAAGSRPRAGRPCSILTSSRLKPPRSPATPVAFGMPAVTPRDDSRASSLPERTRTSKPVSAFTWRTKSGPSSASRTAAVAATCTAWGSSGVQHRAEPLQRRMGERHALGPQPPRLRQVAAQAGQHLLVEDGPDGPPFHPVGDQADRVGAYVDDRRIARRPSGAARHAQGARHVLDLVAPARKARIGHEIVVGGEGPGLAPGRVPGIGAGGVQPPVWASIVAGWRP